MAFSVGLSFPESAPSQCCCGGGRFCSSNLLDTGSAMDASIEDGNGVEVCIGKDAGEATWANANNPLGAGV